VKLISELIDKDLENLRQKGHEIKQAINQKESAINELEQRLLKSQLVEQSINRTRGNIQELEAGIETAKTELQVCVYMISSF